MDRLTRLAFAVCVTVAAYTPTLSAQTTRSSTIKPKKTTTAPAPTPVKPDVVQPTASSPVVQQAAQPAAQQAAPQPSGPQLTVEQAIRTAEQNNPDYLQTVNTQRTASAAKLAAYGGFLPQISANLTGQFQQGGQQFIDGVALGNSSSILQSTYTIGVTYQINAATFISPAVAQANSRAVKADILGAKQTLDATVEQQYLTVLQSQARVSLQDTLIASAQAQLDLAKARAAVGSGTQLDVQRAEVSLGQQQVQRLQAANQFEIDKLKLFQQMGVPQPPNVVLVSTFTSPPPIPALPTLLTIARQQNPAVNALRSREDAASRSVWQQRSEYFPTLSLTTGIGGYTYQYRDANSLVSQAQTQINQEHDSCVQTQEVRAAVNLPNTLDQCAEIVFTDAEATALRQSNDKFPFSFTQSPKSVSAQLSLPIFEGFQRAQRRQEAAVALDNARYATKSRELAMTADVTSAYLTLQTALQTSALQTENSAKARQELKFTQDQYAVGVATFIDLETSRATYAQAESDRINALYDYYKAFSALENAVGRSLR